MRHRLLRPIAVLSILAIAIGCGRSASVTTPEGGKAKVTAKGDEVNVSVAGPEGERATLKAAKSGIALPKGFPTDVAIPKGAKPTMSHEMAGQLHVSFETTQTVAEVLDFYKTAVARAGWQVQATFETPQGSTIGATKDKRTLSVTIGKGKGEDATLVLVTVSK